MKKTIKIYDGTILEEGKKYKWSGHSDDMYYNHIWNNFRCKIKKIDGIEITIRDYENETDYIFTDSGLIKIEAKFTPTDNIGGFFKKLFNK